MDRIISGGSWSVEEGGEDEPPYWWNCDTEEYVFHGRTPSIIKYLDDYELMRGRYF